MKFKLFKQFYPYILPYKLKALGAIFFGLCIAAIGGLQLNLIKPIFDKGLSPDATNEEVYWLAGQLLAYGLLMFPCRFLHFYWLRFIMDRATCTVRENVFKKLIHLPTTFFVKKKQGDLVSHLINDSQVFAGGFKALLDLVREPAKAIVFLGMAFLADWQLTLVIFIMAPLLITIFAISGKQVKKNQKNVQDNYGQLTHNISEGISSHKITKAFNLQHYVSERFKLAQKNFFGSQMKTTFVEEVAHPFVEVVGAMAFAGVIVFAHHRIQIGATTVGEFIQFVGALALFMDPIRKFSQANIKLSQASAARDRLDQVETILSEPNEGHHQVTSFQDKIEIKDLSFSYGESYVVSDLSLTIKKGQKVAFVGASGSGKSTLMSLLLRLYPVDSESIRLDGKNIDDIELKSLRDLFGFVGQEIFLFHDTVKNNLTVGGEFTDEQIKEALDIAYASEFVDKLPQGLNTYIGDRGTRLSGGQQQRLCIARAYLQNPDIFLFDEATSALDNESEKVVQKALENLAGDKTVIAVAHRLSTVQDFDQIYVMRDGHVVEHGIHSDLLKKEGEYSKLYSLGSI